MSGMTLGRGDDVDAVSAMLWVSVYSVFISALISISSNFSKNCEFCFITDVRFALGCIDVVVIVAVPLPVYPPVLEMESVTDVGLVGADMSSDKYPGS